jgi:hypothetical protein
MLRPVDSLFHSVERAILWRRKPDDQSDLEKWDQRSLCAWHVQEGGTGFLAK